ncbi:hypothetical protein HYFRA_00006566 [Hymenoscyphus fraxineus]|uniref:Uncharacterized protein n=1 Tax=Hymenoscyphus fraxineus TaxID=746836 RepID=A0A9N9PTM9_9HELO|nr:hypothetical protein HYFRA_00006566 [Hymenoscyphus fraxineus]
MTPLKILDDYYLLPTGANISHVDKLLGRVVKNHVYPLTRYEPKLDFVPQNLIQGLMGNSNALESVKETSRKDEKSEARGKLTDLVGAHASSEEGQSATVSVYLLKTYDMTQIQPNFEALKQNPTYLASITALFEETRQMKLPMITKVLVCEDVEVATTEDAKSGAGLEATIPGTAIATQGAVHKGPLDGEIDFEHEKSRAIEKTKKISGGIIVGLAYTWVEKQPVQQQKKVKPKLIDRIKSWLRKKEDVGKYDIVVSDNEIGGPYMEAPGEEEVAGQIEGKKSEENSSCAPTIK